MNISRTTLFTLLLALMLFAAPVVAAPGIAVPPFTGRITDAGVMLTDHERMVLNDLLGDYEIKTSNQVFILTLASLGGEDITDFGNRAFRTYKPGQKGKNNGVMLIV